MQVITKALAGTHCSLALSSHIMEGKQTLDQSILRFANAREAAIHVKTDTYLTPGEHIVPVVIEIPKNCPNKYEINHHTGLITLDRVLYSSLYYPGDYGYVPNTLCGDGDPIDAVVFSSYALQPGIMVLCRVIGVMYMTDENGEDSKLICVVNKDPRMDKVNDAADISQHSRDVIRNFFAVYKDLERKTSHVGEIQGREAAIAELVKAINMFKDQHPNEEPSSPSLELKAPDYWHASILPSTLSKHLTGRPVLQYPYRVSAYVEVPSRSNNKYEFDHDSGMVQLDRVLYSATFYPLEYGFVPQTLCEDGDPLDILIIASYPLNVGSMADVRILGMLEMEDEKGTDTKILGVVDNDPRYAELDDITDVAAHILTEIKHFFETYKALEPGKWSRVREWKGKEEAAAEIRRTNAIYLRDVNKPLLNVPRFDRMEIGAGYPSTVNALVTSPKGTSNIYRFDKDLGILRLDRRLHSSMYFPFNSGIIPQTFGDEGNPIQVVIISVFDLTPGCLVRCRVVGKLEIEEETGPDSRVVAVPESEPRLSDVVSVDTLQRHIKDEIFNFFQNYKMLEDRQSWTRVKTWKDKESAERFIRGAHERYYLYGLRIEEMESRLCNEATQRRALEARLQDLEGKYAALLSKTAAS